MKKKKSLLFFFLILGGFFAIRLLPFAVWKKNEAKGMSERPLTSQGLYVKGESLFAHQWIRSQNKLKSTVPEMARDMAILKQFSDFLVKQGKAPLREDELEKELASNVKNLQATLPFTLPRDYYNVLCIPRGSEPTPIPYEIYQRLYLGETPLGSPFYLDVRVFNLRDEKWTEEVMSWHFDALEKGKEAFQEMKGGVFIGKGMKNATRFDASHAFAALQGERGVFLQFVQEKERLIVIHADAPWGTFEKYVNVFEELAKAKK